MASNDGPSPIITDGLVFSADALNPRCWEDGGATFNNLYEVTNSTPGNLYNQTSASLAQQGSWEFDATDDYIQSSNISIGEKMTVGGWLYNDLNWSTARTFLASSHYYSNSSSPVYNGNILIRLESATSVVFAIYDARTSRVSSFTFTAMSADTLSLNNWHNLFITAENGGSAKLYVNGELKASNITVSSMTDGFADFNTGGLVIGADISHTNADWDGFITGVLLYNKVLSASEIKSNYDSTKIRFGL